MKSQKDLRPTFLKSPLLVLAFAVACTSCGNGGPSGDDRKKVFVLAGQSNMVGYGLTSLIPEESSYAPGNVTLYDGGVRTELLSGAQFGPEVAFAQERAGAWPDEEIVLVKYAVPGTSLFAWDPDWTWAEAKITENEWHGPLYDHLMEHIRTAVAGEGIVEGERVDYCGMLWMQGERDASYPEAALQYEANLAYLIERIRSDLGSPGLPFIFGQINPPEWLSPAVDEVRAAQAATEQSVPCTKLVSTEGLSKYIDGVHYDAPGLLELGRRFDLGYEEIAGPDCASP